MSKEKIETYDPKGKEISIAGEKFVVKPFVLRNRTKVLRILYEVFSAVAKEAPDLKANDFKAASLMIPLLIDVAGDKLIEIYEIVLNKPRAWLDTRLMIKDEVALIEAVLEVNDLPFLLQRVKNLTQKTKSV